MDHLDGSALAGPLVVALGVDATAALVVCGRCGRRNVVGASRVTLDGDVWTIECRGCRAVVLRVDAVGVTLPGGSALRA